jgi:hypothetical protein
MTKIELQQAHTIAAQLIADGWSDFYIGDDDLLMGTAPDGTLHAIKVVVVTNDAEAAALDGMAPVKLDDLNDTMTRDR